MNRMVVVGAASLLGQYLVEEAIRQGHLISGTFNNTIIENSNLRYKHMDITDLAEVTKVLTDLEPDVVFLPSALTNVDYCETHEEEAQKVNVQGTMNIASTCRDIGSSLIYISTDYVFDGEKGKRYDESDSTAPLSVYGRTKLYGEQIAQEEDNNLVCRVSALYGWNNVSFKSNFVTWAVGIMRKGKEITLFGDQFVSPTYAPHCAKVLINMAKMGAKGLYHISGPDCIDRYSMGLAIAQAFDLDPSLCKKIKTKDLPLPAMRGKSTCLDVSKMEREFSIKAMTFTEGLMDMRLREKE
jgi:dTDP-4-dehydrorhamnose reductase